jgi:protein TonB
MFQGTGVALAAKVAYMGHDAVSGKITALQAFTPGSPGAPTLTVSKVLRSSNDGPVHVVGGVVAGRLLRKVNPEYPEIARIDHVGGAVLLHAIITREGKIRALFVLASPAPVLSEAAMDAVRHWIYTPYLLNGQPTEVDTTVNVNFNLN